MSLLDLTTDVNLYLIKFIHQKFNLMGSRVKSKNAINYLYSLGRMGIRLGLEPLRGILSVYQNPQDNFDTILVAGTNGKGSTASMIASILRSAGYKVGLYISPHLMDFYERITINGEKINTQRLTLLVEDLKANLKDPLTFFEFLTAIALIYFSQEEVDIAVLEVGMGGRLDATNVVTPLLSIITNIGLDHTEFLGKSLLEIAREKAGIVKPFGTLITSEESEDIQNLFKDICNDTKSKIFILGKDFHCSSINADLHGISFDFTSPQGDFKNIKVPLRGNHQAKNASLAIIAALKLCEFEYKINEHHIRKGINEVIWRGRLEFFSNSRTMLLDCAHNISGILQLCEFLKIDALKENPINFIYGTLFDKDYTQILKILRPIAKNIILSKPNHPRALHPKKIKETLFPDDESVRVRVNPLKALRLSEKISMASDLVCVTGSSFLVADILKELESKEASPLESNRKTNGRYFYLGR